MTKCIGLVVNFIGFSVIQYSQGSVATYVRCGGMSTSAYSKFPAELLESVKIWQRYCKSLGAYFFGTPCAL